MNTKFPDKAKEKLDELLKRQFLLQPKCNQNEIKL